MESPEGVKRELVLRENVTSFQGPGGSPASRPTRSGHSGGPTGRGWVNRDLAQRQSAGEPDHVKTCIQKDHCVEKRAPPANVQKVVAELSPYRAQ